MKPKNERVTRLDYCQYLLVSQINYTLTNYAERTEKFSHDAANRYIFGDEIRPRLVWENVQSQVNMLTISYLAGCPAYLSTVSAWVFGEWGEHMPGLTVEDLTRIFSGHLNRDRIPLTLIAFWDGQPAGTASIYAHDLDVHPDLSPWLAAVYVAPPYRKQGIGSELVKAVESAAQKLQIGRLYLFTPVQERFYTRLGWSVLERVEYWNQTVVVMDKLMR